MGRNLSPHLAACSVIPILLLFLTGCHAAVPSRPAPTILAQPTSTPESVRSTPTRELPPLLPTHTVPPPTPAVSMIELLRYAPGAGGPGDCPGPKPEQTLPALQITSMPPFDIAQQARLLCVYGLPSGEKVRIDLIDPSGVLVDTLYYQVIESLQSIWDGRTMTVIGIQINPSLFFASGEWRIRARASIGQVETGIVVGLCPLPQDNMPGGTGPDDYSAIHYISIQAVEDPPTSMFDLAGFAPFALQGQALVRGACYPPAEQLSVGVFRSTSKGQGMTYTLAHAFAITTNEAGSFEATLALSNLLVNGQGGYYAILPVPEQMRPALEDEFANLYALPHAGFELLPNPDQPDCQQAAFFRRGDSATTINALPVFANPYFLEPGSIAELAMGDDLSLIEGPVCFQGRVWWRVHSPTSGLAGWVDRAGLQP